MRVLVVNAGSSSLKLRALGTEDEVLASGDLPPPGDDRAALRAFVAELPQVDAVGHRIVHGGERFRGPVRIDDAVEEELQALTDLAPLHQPKSLAALDAVGEALPSLPAVACFDTAFHATLPGAAATYALPAEWRRRHGLRRFGFHGLSHGYASRRAAAILGRDDLRVVTCHLGAGCSLAAVRDGRCVDTTMGFTPLEGLVMATRSGSVDPGMLTWMLRRGLVDAEELERGLDQDSGLKGLAGSGDMREVLEAARGGDGAAALALDVYLRSLRAGIASMAAAMDGLDALVFTGGVGENSAEVREGAADGLGFLGVEVDSARNRAARNDADIGASSPVRVLVVNAREDIEIAGQVREALGAAG